MCIITDENDIVVSISLIPGIEPIHPRYHVYFPVNCELPYVGDKFKLEIEQN